MNKHIVEAIRNASGISKSENGHKPLNPGVLVGSFVGASGRKYEVFVGRDLHDETRSGKRVTRRHMIVFRAVETGDEWFWPLWHRGNAIIMMKAL